MKVIYSVILLMILLLGQQVAFAVVTEQVAIPLSASEQAACQHTSMQKTGAHSQHGACCQTACHCAANSCHATGLIFTVSMIKQLIPNRMQSILCYQEEMPQRIPVSLFRPPILS